MDVPTRQAYVMAVVDPSERTAAAAYTNTARYITRPIAPLIAGATLRGALGAPFFIAGTSYLVALLIIHLLVPKIEPVDYVDAAAAKPSRVASDRAPPWASNSSRMPEYWLGSVTMATS